MIQAAAIERVPCPPPGVYEGVPAETYFSWDALSNSAMQVMAERSPAHLLEVMRTPESKRYFMVGRAFHTWLLEPATFSETYIMHEFGGRSNADKEALAEIETRGFIPLAMSDFEVIDKMASAVKSHSIAGPLIDMLEMQELSLVWNEPAMTLDRKLVSVACKARVDGLSRTEDGHYIAIDPKSCKSAATRDFRKSFYNFGYYRQAPWYLHLLKRNKIHVPHFLFIAVEKEPPFGVNVFKPDDIAMEAGRKDFARHLTTYATCVDRGEFPSYDEEIKDLSLPGWAAA